MVERDADGKPTGILREESAWRFRDRYVTVTEDEWVDATREGIRVANANGVGAIHDKDGWLGAASIFGRIHEQEGLSLRVWQSLPVDRLPEIAALPLRARIGDDFLRLGYVKTFMDGTLGSQTALMLDGSGVEITSREELEEIIRAAAAVGWPVAVHAIGDRANRNALDAFEATQEAWKPLGLRHRIEHAQCLDPADVPRFAELGIACSVQLSHAPSDRDLAERFWGDRLDGTYAFRSLLDSGAVLVNGSDAPVEELDPLAGILAGCCGRSTTALRGNRQRRSRSSRRSSPRPSRRPGSRATSAAVDGCCPGSSPISWCSRATRSPARPTSSNRSRSCRRWWAASGCIIPALGRVRFLRVENRIAGPHANVYCRAARGS